MTTAAIPVRKFDPRKDGIERWFGPLETEIMAYLWDRPLDWVPVKTVHETLDPDDRSYTTFMTTLGRLYTNGVLEREKRGLAYYYRPVCSLPVFEDAQFAALRQSMESN